MAKEKLNQLNENEKKVFNAILEVAKSYGEDGNYTNDEAYEGLDMSWAEFKGYLSSLSKKGIIDIFPKGEYYFDGSIIDWLDY